MYLFIYLNFIGSSSSGSGFSSGGGFGGSPSSPAGYASINRAPTATMGRISGSPGVARSSAPRPQVNIPRASQSQPTRVVYSTIYNNYGGGGYRSSYYGNNNFFSGYMLGSMMGRSHCYGCYGSVTRYRILVLFIYHFSI